MSNEAKYILVGLPKCGTTSFTKMFEEAGIPSCHWSFHSKNGETIYVGWAMKENAEQHRPLLSHHLEKFQAFLQMDCDRRNVWPQITMIEQLTAQYPNSYYILNTRNIHHHARSMFDWYGLKVMLDFFDVPNLQIQDRSKGVSLQNIETWIIHHNNRIRQHFQSNPHIKFMEVNIEDPGLADKIGNFTGLKGLRFPHVNKSTDKTKTGFQFDIKTLEYYKNQHS